MIVAVVAIMAMTAVAMLACKDNDSCDGSSRDNEFSSSDANGNLRGGDKDVTLDSGNISL